MFQPTSINQMPRFITEEAKEDGYPICVFFCAPQPATSATWIVASADGLLLEGVEGVLDSCESENKTSCL